MEFKGTKGKWVNNDGNIVDENNIEVVDIITLSKEDEANALLISKAPEMLEELKETIVDLKILRNQIALESKNVHHWEGMPELIDEWINRKEQLIKEATEL